jgi:hypothetical protein
MMGFYKTLTTYVLLQIVFVEKKKAQETLLSVFDADHLPVEYGGTAELVLLEDAVVPGWPPVKQDPSS